MSSSSHCAPQGGGDGDGGPSCSSYDYLLSEFVPEVVKRERDRSRSPVRGQQPGCSAAARRLRIPEEPAGWELGQAVRLDLYNCDLWLMVEPDGVTGRPLSDGGFANMWAGGQATHAAVCGTACRAFYEVRVGQHNREVAAPPEERQMFLVRCGWSRLGAGMVLGEEPMSYGYGGSGRASTRGEFRDYGGTFDTGDVVGCFLEYRDDGVPLISYSLNGRSLGVCYEATEARHVALFPHLLTKNVEFEVNFGQHRPWYPPGDASWLPIGQLSPAELQRNYLPPAKREDCAMLMMCGLPAAGKSAWAEKHRRDRPECRYCVLGTNSILDRLRVKGLPRQRNYNGRWEMLIERATKCLNALFKVACLRKRNYILDQTNVYASAQASKVAPFDGYRRVAVVVVPEDAEYRRRLDQQRRVEGKEVPDQAIDTMKANFAIPREGPLFDEVLFPELPRPEAEVLVARYNREAAASCGGGGGQQQPRSNYGRPPQQRSSWRGVFHRGNRK